MTEYGRFNTDAQALTRRIHAHEKYGSNDLNPWIFEHLELAAGLSVLELGCGTGKQSLPTAQIVGDSGHVLSVDISQDALHTLSESAEELGLGERISLLCCGLDDLDRHLNGQVFDRVLSSYSIYYAKDPRRVFNMVRQALKPGGIFFFCGPAKDNNSEIKQFHYALRGVQPPPEQGAAVFMEEIAQQLAGQFFSEIMVSTFQNPLRFDSSESLYEYWSSYNLYDEKLDVAFRFSAARYFQTHSVFETVKRVVGVRGTSALS